MKVKTRCCWTRRTPPSRVEEYAYNETRYRMLLQSDEARAEMLMHEAKSDVAKRWNLYQQMAAIQYKAEDE